MEGKQNFQTLSRLGFSRCTEALDEALALSGKPEIFSIDQGSQFARLVFIQIQAAKIRIRSSPDERLPDGQAAVMESNQHSA